MKHKQIFLAVGLILTLIFSFSALASAGILDNASQIVNLTAGSTSATVLPLNVFSRVNPDGTSVTFDPGSSVVVVINKIMWRFKPDNAQTNPVQLRLTVIPFSSSGVSFYSKKSGVGGDGFASENDSVTPGIPVKVQNAAAWGFYVVDLVTGQPISGSLSIRMVGFMTPNQ